MCYDMTGPKQDFGGCNEKRGISQVVKSKIGCRCLGWGLNLACGSFIFPPIARQRVMLAPVQAAITMVTRAEKCLKTGLFRCH